MDEKEGIDASDDFLGPVQPLLAMCLSCGALLLVRLPQFRLSSNPTVTRLVEYTVVTVHLSKRLENLVFGLSPGGVRVDGGLVYAQGNMPSYRHRNDTATSRTVVMRKTRVSG